MVTPCCRHPTFLQMMLWAHRQLLPFQALPLIILIVVTTAPMLYRQIPWILQQPDNQPVIRLVATMQATKQLQQTTLKRY